MKPIDNLSCFRPLTIEMISRIKVSIKESKRLLDTQLNLPEEKRDLGYEQYLNNHIEMLQNELRIAGCKECQVNA